MRRVAQQELGVNAVCGFCGSAKIMETREAPCVAEFRGDAPRLLLSPPLASGNLAQPMTPRPSPLELMTKLLHFLQPRKR